MMQNNNLVSIAMCTYNGEKYLREQIESILAQSHSNIELVIVDDCSKDRTVEIVKKFQQTDSRITLIINEKNLGFVKNFEKSISLCKGNFIAPADQDDIWHPKKIELLLSNIGDHGLIYSDAIPINENSERSSSGTFLGKNNLVSGKNKLAFLFFNCISGNTLMFKADLLKYILPFPTNINYHDIWIAFVAASFDGIELYQEPLIYYRRHSDQVTKTRDKNYNSLFDRLKTKESNYKKNSLQILNLSRAFLDSKLLTESEFKLVNDINEHFSTLEKGFFNFGLYRQLRQNSNLLFSIKKRKHFKYSIKYSAKLNLIRLSCYSL